MYDRPTPEGWWKILHRLGRQPERRRSWQGLAAATRRFTPAPPGQARVRISSWGNSLAPDPREGQLANSDAADRSLPC